MFGSTIKLKTTIIAVCLMVVTGCTATYRNHGYMPSDEDLEQIKVGVDTKETVNQVIGAPSTSGVLNNSGYYYVRSRIKEFGIQKPEEIERQVLAISFDSAGKVTNIERFGLQDGQIVPLSRRVTSSSIENKGFLRQLMGNLGRFAAGDFLN